MGGASELARADLGACQPPGYRRMPQQKLKPFLPMTQ
jgi:hypothetical protein